MYLIVFLLLVTFQSSLSTLHREFAALMGLPYYDMAETILRPRLCRPEEFNYDEIRRAMESHRVNEPQAKAILSSVKTKGFSLIQGSVKRRIMLNRLLIHK